MAPKTLTYLIAILTALSFLTPLIAAKKHGINCQSSKQCKGFVNPGFNPVGILEVAVNQSSDARIVSNGQNIACVNGMTDGTINGALCVWMWNTNNDTAIWEVKVLYQRFIQHGCKGCGNVPRIWGTNDNSKGVMTVGWSDNPQFCNGVCNEKGGTDYTAGTIVASAGLIGAPPSRVGGGKQRREEVWVA